MALACAVLVDVTLSVAAYGPQGAWREHVTWWNDGAAGTQLRQLTSEKAVDEDRLTNQSVAVTLRRLLSTLGTIRRCTSRASTWPWPTSRRPNWK